MDMLKSTLILLFGAFTYLLMAAVEVESKEIKYNEKKFERLKNKADKNFDAYSYEKAIFHYKKALAINENPSVELKLANSYRLLNQPEEAELWYRAALDNMTLSDEDMLNFGQVLSANGKYEEALAIYEKYQHKEDWVNDHVEALRNVDRFYVNEIAFEIRESLFNSAEKDFSPTFKNGEVVFVSGRPSSGIMKPEYNWDGSNFLDLFTVSEGEVPEKIHRGINTRFHEGPAAFFDNGEKMFFTRNNYLKKQAGESEEGVNMLKLYYSERKDATKWKKPVEFVHNDDHYSTGHPTVSSDGKILYFASDRPGGFGGVDLYKSVFVNGEWSEPQNLGARFNTAEDEMFPFLHNDKVLYFASAGHEGLGGLDVFRAELGRNHSPRNMGFPLNTNADDFGIAFEGEMNKGYFSSNRVGGTGDDDIYNILMYDYILDVTLIDAVTEEPISGQIEIREFFPPDIVDLVDSISGSNLQFRALKGSKFSVDGFAEGYEDGNLEILTTDNSGEILKLSYELPLSPIRREEAEIVVVENNGVHTQVIALESNVLRIHSGSVENLKETYDEEGIDVVKEILLRNIYYDFDEFNIREDAAKELDKIYQFLGDNRQVYLTLESHTDVRGSNSYNEILAKRRAISAKDYLVERGIDNSRIRIESFGELENHNDCKESICSEEDHQSNRRTEIKLRLPNSDLKKD